MLPHLPFLLQLLLYTNTLLLYTNKLPLGCHLSLKHTSNHTQHARQPPPPFITSSLNTRDNLKDSEIPSKPLAVFWPSLHSHGLVDSSSRRHATLYHTDEDCHPGAPPINTPNPDGSAVVACLTTMQRLSQHTGTLTHAIQKRKLLEFPLPCSLPH